MMNTEPKSKGMKHFAALLLCLMLSASVRADEEGLRTFSDKQGRTFKGRLMDYDAVSESVVIARSDGKKGSVQLSVLSDEDRHFILDWGASRRFMEGLELIPSLNAIKVSEKDSGISDVTKRVFDTCYELRFINRTDAPLGRIEFEYCIFYNQGEREGRTVQFEEGVCYGKGVVELIDPSSAHVSKTKPIRLFTEGGKVGIFGTETTALANMRGIWLRIKTTLPSGSEVVREYRTADDADWKWAPYSFGAGLNEGERKQTHYYIK